MPRPHRIPPRHRSIRERLNDHLLDPDVQAAAGCRIADSGAPLGEAWNRGRQLMRDSAAFKAVALDLRSRVGHFGPIEVVDVDDREGISTLRARALLPNEVEVGLEGYVAKSRKSLGEEIVSVTVTLDGQAVGTAIVVHEPATDRIERWVYRVAGEVDISYKTLRLAFERVWTEVSVARVEAAHVVGGPKAASRALPRLTPLEVADSVEAGASPAFAPDHEI